MGYSCTIRKDTDHISLFLMGLWCYKVVRRGSVPRTGEAYKCSLKQKNSSEISLFLTARIFLLLFMFDLFIAVNGQVLPARWMYAWLELYGYFFFISDRPGLVTLDLSYLSLPTSAFMHHDGKYGGVKGGKEATCSLDDSRF